MKKSFVYDKCQYDDIPTNFKIKYISRTQLHFDIINNCFSLGFNKSLTVSLELTIVDILTLLSLNNVTRLSIILGSISGSSP